jgi:hypothetical protein
VSRQMDTLRAQMSVLQVWNQQCMHLQFFEVEPAYHVHSVMRPVDSGNPQVQGHVRVLPSPPLALQPL